MKQRILIASIDINQLRPLSWQGIQAISCYDQLARILQNSLSPAHFALLAEPLLDNQALTADWYALVPATQNQGPVEIKPIKLLDLPPEEQAQIHAYMISLGREVYDLAQELKASTNSNTKTAGTLLEMALNFPGDEFIYVLGNQPVLIGWGYTSDQANAESEQLTRLRTATVPLVPEATMGEDENIHAQSPLPRFPEAGVSSTDVSSAPEQITNQAVANTKKSLVPWAIITFLLGALIAGLLLFWFKPSPFELGGELGGSCSRTVLPVTNSTADGPSELEKQFLRAQAQEELLRAELAQLRQEYNDRLLECKEPSNKPSLPLVPETPPALEPEPEPETSPPVAELTMPELPPDPPPKPDPKPKPTPAPKPKSNYLEIPDNSTDLAFLEGCWEAEIAQGTPGRSNTTPQRLVYCFDENGKGNSILSERSSGRPVCEGRAEGELRGDSLRIKDLLPLRPASCMAETITCKNASSGVAECSSVFEDGGKSKLVFRRR